MAALPFNSAPLSSSSPKQVISGIFSVTHTVDTSASSTAGPSNPVLPKLSSYTPQASQSYPNSPSPSPNARVASRITLGLTSTETQRTISSGAKPPTRITGNGGGSSSRSRPTPAPPRYEQAPPPGLSEKRAIPFGSSVPKACPPPPLLNGFSRASSSTGSSSSSSWSIDEKAGALPPYLFDVSEDPLRRGTMNNVKHFSSVPMRSVSSCPSPYPNSRCPSTSITMTIDAAHRSSLIEHQRHYGHRVKPPSCLRFTIPPAVKPWLPMCTWFATTIGLIVAVAFWRTEVFTGLDDLSTYMKQEGYYGQAILFGLILLTTFPPLPLYSTLMMLAGYTFGPATAFFISYFASLLGALVVFLIFRHFVPSRVAQGLLPPSLKRVVRAIEQRPSIFLLIRVAPYPYNVLNAVLGSSSNMGIRTYMGTTAISLLKVIVHTSLGSEIRSFKDLHATNKAASGDTGKGREITWGEIWTGIGIVLCVGLFVYLSIVARRAVNEECEHDGYEALPTTVVPPSPLAPPAHAPPQMRTLDGQSETRHASFNPFHPLTNPNENSGSHAHPHSHPDNGELRNASRPRSPQEMGEFTLPHSSYSQGHTLPRPLSA